MTDDEIRAVQNGNTLRTIVVLLGIVGSALAAYVGISGEIKAAIGSHSERPHIDAVEKPQYRIDMQRLESKIDRIGEHAMGSKRWRK